MVSLRDWTTSNPGPLPPPKPAAGRDEDEDDDDDEDLYDPRSNRVDEALIAFLAQDGDKVVYTYCNKCEIDLQDDEERIRHAIECLRVPQSLIQMQGLKGAIAYHYSVGKQTGGGFIVEPAWIKMTTGLSSNEHLHNLATTLQQYGFEVEIMGWNEWQEILESERRAAYLTDDDEEADMDFSAEVRRRGNQFKGSEEFERLGDRSEA